MNFGTSTPTLPAARIVDHVPMTIAMLLRNRLIAAYAHAGRRAAVRRGACSFLPVLLALAATPGAARPDRAESFAEPGDIIAAESAFQHLRTEKGPRAAMRATAQADAQTFAPLPTRVSEILKRPSEPSLPPTWQPHRVWMSCDGSYAISTGAWQQLPAQGWFVTVWHRQKGGASYKWVLDLGDTQATPLPAPDMIAASVADCPERHGRNPVVPAADRAPAALRDYTSGHADDDTLMWVATSGGHGAVGFIGQLKQNGAWHDVLRLGQTQGSP